MTYDLRIRTDLNGFTDYLEKKGATEMQGKMVLRHTTPFLEFGYVNGIVTFPFLRSHYNINFVYHHLLECLNGAHDLSFEDLQNGRVFSKRNSAEITDAYLKNAGLQYAKMNRAFVDAARRQGQQIESDTPYIPVPFRIADILFDDLYSFHMHILTAKETYSANFLRPFIYVNPKQENYAVTYVWSELVDCIIPLDIPITYLCYGTKKEGSSEILLKTYDYKEFMSLIPEPTIFESPPYIGKRALYKNCDTEENKNKIAALTPVTIPTEYLFDENAVSIFSWA